MTSQPLRRWEPGRAASHRESALPAFILMLRRGLQGRRRVGRIAGDLKPEYAEALRGVEVEGLSLKDFAEKAGITPNNAAVRVHRAREALRKRLVSTCATCAAKGCTDCTCQRDGGHEGHEGHEGRG